MAMWQCGNVAMWQCGNVTMWQCGNVAVWQCGNVAVWRRDERKMSTHGRKLGMGKRESRSAHQRREEPAAKEEGLEQLSSSTNVPRRGALVVDALGGAHDL